MPKIFISHATTDRELVTSHVTNLLKDHEVDFWFAEDDCAVGSEWESDIRAALEHCDWFLVVLTPDALKSKWVKAEVHWAFRNRTGRIVPVLMKDCEHRNLHLSMELLQYVDFRNLDDDAKSRLLNVFGIRFRKTRQFHVRYHNLGERYTIEREANSVDRYREFVGYDQVLKRRVLIKCEGQGYEKSGDGIQREALALAKLSHPNIHAVYDFFEDVEAGMCSVLEYTDGVTFTRVLDDNELHHAKFVCRLISQIARALQHAHENGILHLNIKPNSIVVRNGGLPFLTNFISCEGVLKVQFGGTPVYMAPEQLRTGATRDARTDVWGLGVLLYQSITGRRPFDEKGEQLRNQILNSEPVLPRKLNKSISKDLERVCMKSIQKLPAERHSSADDFAADLEKSLNAFRWWRNFFS